MIDHLDFVEAERGHRYRVSRLADLVRNWVQHPAVGESTQRGTYCRL